LQSDAFAPGERLQLIPEPNNRHDPNAVGVWDGARRTRLGYIPADDAKRIKSAMSRHDLQAVALWEYRDAQGNRSGVRILIAPAIEIATKD
jgi:hypothetical protein